MKIYNGENVTITIVSDGNADVVIPAKGFATIEFPETGNGKEYWEEGFVRSETPQFGSESFYVQEDGDWYAESNGSTGADLEIYISEK